MRSLFKKIIVSVLVFQAKLILRKYSPTVVAITGNVGKTSTKDAIGAVLMEHYHTRASAKSFNSEFGVPLTILGEDTGWGSPFKWFLIILRGFEQILFTVEYPEILVLEVGADTPGDIKKITKWLHPDITVVTQFQKVPVHIEFFKNREALIAEKGYLVRATKKSGVVLFTSDDHDSHELSKLSKAKITSFGFENWSDIRIESLDTLYEVYGDTEAPAGVSARITMNDTSIPLRIMGVLGGGMMYAALPALYIGTLFDINLIEGANALTLYDKPKGRMRLVRGIKKTTIIDDTYNASPKAVEHALKTLESLHTDGKKIAVLGDMLELGIQSDSEHYRIGQVAAGSVHMLVTIGKRSRSIAEGALAAGMSEEYIYQFNTATEAGVFVETLLANNDIILVKGSQSIRAEKVVEEIMAAPDMAHELLVRQDSAWANK
jgi:UDP-N-acetylmuramoyl-tripeptide--D-alanyl-D-alanine ligase